jgi:hypothetical protein
MEVASVSMSEECAAKSEQRQGHDNGLFVMMVLSTTSTLLQARQ